MFSVLSLVYARVHASGEDKEIEEKQDFYTSRFKPFRNKLAKYDARQIVSRGISSLHNGFANNSYAWLRKPGTPSIACPMPWDVLLLIKWALIYGGNKLCFDATHNDFINLCNRVHDFHNRIPDFDDDEQKKLRKFIRTIAFQQFWLQREFMHVSDFGRQLVLFTGNTGGYPFMQKFFHYTGVQIDEFLELSFGLITLFYKDKPLYCTQENFSVLKNAYSAQTIDKFFQCLSLDFDEAKNYITQYGQQIKNPEYQLTERSPLKQFPLLRQKEKYFPYFLPLLYASILDFIYDLLKNKDQSEFSESFGKAFQSYIQKGLEYLNADFRDDRSLVSTYGETKQVDFVLMESDCIVLIESKAIEMSPLARVNPTKVILENYFQDSILKALRQIYSTVRSMVAEPEKIGVKHITQIFALVITFKELYLFNGNSVWEEFAKDKISSFLKGALIDSKLLPPCNIFFITIEEYDLLLTILKTGDESLSKILNKAIQDDLNPQTAKYVFKNHLENYSVQETVLPYVEEAADKIFSRP